MGFGHPPAPLPQPPSPVVTSDIREAEARLQEAIESNSNTVLNELVHTNRIYAAATARMASLEAQMASLKTDLNVANGELDARREKVRLLK